MKDSKIGQEEVRGIELNDEEDDSPHLDPPGIIAAKFDEQEKKKEDTQVFSARRENVATSAANSAANNPLDRRSLEHTLPAAATAVQQPPSQPTHGQQQGPVLGSTGTERARVADNYQGNATADDEEGPVLEGFLPTANMLADVVADEEEGGALNIPTGVVVEEDTRPWWLRNLKLFVAFMVGIVVAAVVASVSASALSDNGEKPSSQPIVDSSLAVLEPNDVLGIPQTTSVPTPPPSPFPSKSTTHVPTPQPSLLPSKQITLSPTPPPSPFPSEKPTPAPTPPPSPFPSKKPTPAPTKTPRMSLTDICIHVGDHWGLSSTEATKPTIKISGVTYYPLGSQFQNIPQNSEKCAAVGYRIPNLTPVPLELRIQIDGHNSDYVWTLTPDQWFVSKSHTTAGQDTNGNKKYLYWEFTVE